MYSTILKELQLIQFKNFNEANILLSEKINCFVGNNGSGKTNILDAIHYLSVTKSYFNPIDSQNIQYNNAFFMVEGVYDKAEQKEKIYCGL